MAEARQGPGAGRPDGAEPFRLAGESVRTAGEVAQPAAELLRSAGELSRLAGDRAILLTPTDRAYLPAVVGAVRTRALAGVQDVLPAAETVLVTLVSTRYLESARRELTRIVADICAEPPPPVDVSRGTSEAAVRIPVHYHGEDLGEVAAHLGISPAEVVAAHTGTTWRCAFVGFAPGFGYLESGDGRLTVPRRATARTAIPAGAVALAGGYSAVYPRATPGGWQLIGHTDAVPWDVDRDPPALIRAGAAVRFVNAEG